MARRNTPHVNAFNDFSDRNNLLIGLDNPASLVEFTFESAGTNSRSLIDHFLVSDNLYDNIMLYEAHNSIDNFSDHVALTCMFNNIILENETEDRIFRQHPAWYKASPQQKMQFSENLAYLLRGITGWVREIWKIITAAHLI